MRYVNVNSLTPAAPYTTWATAAADIQSAVDAAAAGDLILVTNGVYATGGRAVYGAMTNRVAVTKAVTVQSVNGPELTIIRGYQVPGTTNGNGAIRCVYLADGAFLNGFTLTNGATRKTGDPREQRGGGLLCVLTNAGASNCVLTGNAAFEAGGGACEGTLNNCTLSGNSAIDGGGAVGGTLNYCTLTGNSATNSGGGAANCELNHCTLTGNSAFSVGGGASYSSLNHCTLTGNSARYVGGGAFSSGLTNCTLTGNTSFQDGGGASGGTLSNCTVAGNSASRRGGGVYRSDLLVNCTLTGNAASSGGGVCGETDYTPAVLPAQ
jgi:hypothetical protein